MKSRGESRGARSRTSTASKPQPKGQQWRVKFGFWTEQDELYSLIKPPIKPRQSALPQDGAAEW